MIELSWDCRIGHCAATRQHAFSSVTNWHVRPARRIKETGTDAMQHLYRYTI
ncbi:hypothetical protein ACFPL7_19700 [Dongia soli]|uniref:Uncharacterized protein n=1 Tax=Dongia soli TaxID=600628 RepID=A0ABU5E7V9_9PROT|nr:hypothetical protein [Dongia soli]MDY0881814.1 hypothetical protein [Dongia soli]